ncbi:uncharacterized protein LOC130675883 [Microplitis mediator]|uniref:uncharacterized protein LOC130675883 n=1 Tax=Microplitis mediator TaxID=375433 RepID=UPI00255237DA|nr:uncharacterized protein LOC130675883 [Microplitis mediator]
MPDTDEVIKLKKQRASLKTKFTRFLTFVNDEKNKNNITEIKLRMEKLDDIVEKFEDIQSSISELTKESADEFVAFEKQYFENISRVHDMIQKRKAETSVAVTTAENGSSSNSSKINIRLPKVELMTFNGTFDKWLAFRETFKSVVDKNPDYDDGLKLNYLKLCLRDEALAVINALEITEANYKVAWELLEKRYTNKRVIIQNHVTELMKLENIPKESASDLRKLLDTTYTHIRSLKTLGEPVEHWNTLLIYIITSKVDKNTHREWEKSITGTEMPTWEAFTEFLEQRCQILQVTSINLNNFNGNNVNGTHKLQHSNNNHKKHALTSTKRAFACIVCQESHKLYACDDFKKLGINEKYNKLKAAKLCFNCLNSGHRNSDCKWAGCKTCGSKHNTLLHVDRNDKTTEFQRKELNCDQETQSNIKVYSAIISTQVLLSTALIKIQGKTGKMFQARVLLDSGSQSHFITRKFAELLKMPFKSVNLPVEGLNRVETRIKHAIQTNIYSRTTDYRENIEFLVIPRICEYLPNQVINKQILNIPHKIQLADPEFNEPNEIDALLGAEIFYDLLCTGQIELTNSKAKLHNTKLGWIISGKIMHNDTTAKSGKCMIALNSLHKTISKFWEIEEIEKQTFLSEEEFQVEEHFKQTTKRDPVTGRYIVRLPFNEKINKLGESYTMAVRQFYSLEKRLAKDLALKAQYIDSMKEAISLGHMREVNLKEIQGKHCFLPHHPVIKESSSTTKVRVVYNASAKTSTGISLNDCLKVGPVVQHTSFDIILRFRTHQIVMLADIEKMYKQILLDARDAQYQLILWRETSSDELKAFIIPVVLFGIASAPHSATRVLNQCAEDEKTRFPLASDTLKRDCYVDDVMTGADNLEDAIKLREELIGITKAGGFNLRKWVSNNPEVIKSSSDDTRDINLLTCNNSEMKALGIQWNNVSDEIKYKVTEESNLTVTKRSVLSNIARLYDPIGLIGPVIVSAKILMQQLWQCNAGWDETLPPNIYTAWNNLRKQLPELNKIKFDRKIIINNAKRIEVHGFSDASEKAYGAVIYVRSIDINNKVTTNLLCSKNRIAPLKTISLPKLELCAALLLSRLIDTVLKAINKQIDKIYLWSDSTITLQWINTQPYLLKTFVANRVSEIRELTSTMHWRHVPSEDNMADVLSRGQLPVSFVDNEFWKIGPKWLRLDEKYWPSHNIEAVPLPELKPSKHTFTTVQMPNPLLTKYSSIDKTKRIIAYIFRFKNNTTKTNEKLSGYLSVTELENALIKILQMTQQEHFQEDLKQLSKAEQVKKNSRLGALDPFIDDKGIIRVGGRLKHSLLSYAEKHPIVLPTQSHITRLIIQKYHAMTLHGGTLATLNAVRSRYWPINGKTITKAVLRNCITCFRAKPTDYPYFMGNLPRNRVVQTRPFLNTGIDYCGPFFIKEKKHRNRGKIKVYICIFVCFATKAIHIELASDLSTETFISCLRRFFARRGRSLNLYSDNATNFTGAKNN